jgi:hypothetical protein
MDYGKGFLAKIIMKGENYSWMQNLDYEHVSFHCRSCFEIGHLVANFPKGPRKVKKHH